MNSISHKGRGALSSPANRFESLRRVSVDDPWQNPDLAESPQAITEIGIDASRSVITRNQSPDVPFELSVNAYRGCEHGCVYCFARPTHAYLGLSPGLDFETRIFFKPDAPAQLEQELSRPGYRCRPIAMGTNTDPYQPAERRLAVTRRLLQVLQDASHPVSIVTKSTLVSRDLDLLSAMAQRRLVTVHISLTTLDDELKRRMEPRAASAAGRLETLSRLRDAGVPCGVLVAPLVPGLNDPELESLLEAARDAGATSAGWILLRLPMEVRDLFVEWLECHYPDRAGRVMSLLSDCHGGRDYDARYHRRMRGRGPVARLLSRRFELARRRLGFGTLPELDTSLFRPPGGARAQLRLL